MKTKKKTWKDIKLGAAIELMRLERDVEQYEPIDYLTHRLSILEDKDPDEIEKMPTQKVFDLHAEWSLDRTPAPKFVPFVKVGDREYGIAALDKLTMAQMVDIEEYYKQGLEDSIDKIISILVLPVAEKTLLGKKTLSDYEYDEERVQELKELDMEFVWQNILFFWTGVSRYISGFQDYLEEEQEKMKETKQMPNLLSMLMAYTEKLVQEKQSLTRRGILARLSTRNGAGSEQSTRSAEET